MNGQPRNGFENFGRKVDEKVAEAMPRLEEEVRKVITYLNDEVVPDVRHHSIKALRIASEELAKLVDKFEKHTGGTNTGSGPGGSR